MESKMFEIRDKGTFIPILAIKLSPGNEADRYLLARAGFGRSPAEQAGYVMLCQVAGGNGRCVTDVYEWTGPARTYPQAHRYIDAHFDELVSGDVIDVEFILGERPAPKISEREECPL